MGLTYSKNFMKKYQVLQKLLQFSWGWNVTRNFFFKNAQISINYIYEIVSSKFTKIMSVILSWVTIISAVETWVYLYNFSHNRIKLKKWAGWNVTIERAGTLHYEMHFLKRYFLWMIPNFLVKFWWEIKVHESNLQFQSKNPQENGFKVPK